MAKTTGPLFSLTASGTIGDTITYSIWKGIAYVRQRVIPTYSNTTEQANVRAVVTDASKAWKAGSVVGGITIDTTYKAAYATAAQGMAMSGFNLFLKETMDLNNSTQYDGSLAIRTSPVGA